MNESLIHIQSLLQRAAELHHTGDLNEAEVTYRQVLKFEENHFLATANIGSIHLLKGNWLQAENYLRLAIKVNASRPELYSNLAVALKEQGKIQEAITAYKQVITLLPTDAQAYHSLGIAYCEIGSFEAALSAFEQACVLVPDNPEIHHDLGVMLFKQGHLEEAALAYRKALQLNPQYAQVFQSLGLLLKAQKKYEEAIASFQQMLALYPDYPDGYQQLGACFALKNMWQEAITAYERFLTLSPGSAEIHSALGYAYLLSEKEDHLKTANEHCQKAVALNPHSAGAHSHLGLVFKAKEDYGTAIQCFNQALLLRPDFPEAHCNLGLVYHQIGRVTEAIHLYQRAISLKPDYPLAHLGLAMAKLLLDDYTIGWSEYEWRLQTRENNYQLSNIERWNGSQEGTQEILIIEEQGVGDILQFMRYGSLLKQHFLRVTLAVRKPLCDLIKATHIFDRVYALPTDQFDISPGAKWIPILSLPQSIGVTRTTPQLQEPYLTVPSEPSAKWQAKIRSTAVFTIGLNWQGDPKTEAYDFKGRSFPLSTYEPLAALPGIQFVSLQKGWKRHTKSVPFLTKTAV